MLCFVLIGCAIVGLALIPTYAQIGIAAPILAVAARMIQGFSLGGEVGCNTAFLLEAAPLEKRAMVVSWQGASQLLALIAGGLVGVLLTTILPTAALNAYGWRIAFLLGAATVPFGFWLRSNLPETLHMPELTNEPAIITNEGKIANEPRTTYEPKIIYEPKIQRSRGAEAYSHWRVFVLSLAAMGSMTIATYIFTYLVTYSQATLHLPARIGFIATCCGYAVGIAAIFYGGRLSDKYGRRPVNVWGNLGFLLMIYPAFTWITATHSAFAFIVSMTLLNGASNFTLGSFLAMVAESLPKSIRGSGFAVIYSVSVAAFGGTTQLAVTWLIHVTGSAMAPAWYMLGAGAVGQVALRLMNESAPVRLAAQSAQAQNLS
jgi:MFS family permease